LPVPEPPTSVGAEAWLLYDAGNEVMLLSSNIDEARSLASVTKLMTALVALDHASIDDIVTVTQEAADVGEAEVGLVAGEQWTLWELLNAIVVRSGNDAAVAIAEHVGGDVEGFADLMNQKAVELGMTSSRFTNPHGLDDEGHFTSAQDLLILAQAALDEPIISRLARTRVVKFRPNPEGVERRAANTNELLGAYPGVTGLKTGFTSQAGRVLVSSAVRGDRELIAVVMGSEDHFADTRILLEYGFATMGAADLFRAGFVEEQGGGGAPPQLPEWFAVRIGAMPPMDIAPSGDHQPTPLERALLERFDDLVPAILGQAT
jgi:D-alanyl-D-alanine carboxypeptidase